MAPSSERTAFEALVRDVIAPLVHRDSGTVEVEWVNASEVILWLRGACAGCPGAPITRERVIEPLVKAHFGNRLTVRVEATLK